MSRLSSHFANTAKYAFLAFDVNEEKNASSTTKLLTASRPTNVLSTALYKTTNHKNELRKKLLG